MIGIIDSGQKIVTDGLALHLDAAQLRSYPGSGTTWTDLSGNGRNFTWVSTPSFTSGPIPYFSTNGNKCTGPASNSFGINNTSGYTITMICLQNTLTQNHAFKFYKAGSDTANRGIAPHLSWTDGNIYFDQGGCCGSDTRTQVASGGTSTWNMWTFRRLTDSSTRSIIKNTSVLATNTNAAANLDLISTAVDLGSSDGYPTNPWNARLGAFLVYNRGLSDTEIAQNFNALRSRFGL
jgi:hypothetical protein